jgi:hypothetical protein
MPKMIKELLAKQNDLEINIAKESTDEIIKTAEHIIDEIWNYNKEKSRGAMLRSTAEWME